MSMNYLTKLNMDQRDIVDQFVSSSVSSICIVAGAGVGKTSTIVAGIINMIKNHRRNPELFFITTFTRKIVGIFNTNRSWKNDYWNISFHSIKFLSK